MPHHQVPRYSSAASRSYGPRAGLAGHPACVSLSITQGPSAGCPQLTGEPHRHSDQVCHSHAVHPPTFGSGHPRLLGIRGSLQIRPWARRWSSQRLAGQKAFELNGSYEVAAQRWRAQRQIVERCRARWLYGYRRPRGRDSASSENRAPLTTQSLTASVRAGQRAVRRGCRRSTCPWPARLCPAERVGGRRSNIGHIGFLLAI